MNKHTPTPWSYQHKSDAYTHIIRGPNNRFICQFHQSTDDTTKANAAFIVRACNAHDQLVEALELALARAESWIHDQLDGTSSLESELAELEPCRAALKAASDGE